MSASGIIFSNIHDNNIPELTGLRTVASVPFACRYRFIDFTLSNMVNSGIERVGIPTQDHYRSLMDHLGSGAAWDLNRKRHGLVVLPPIMASSDMQGDLDVLNSILDYISASHRRYVVICGSDLLYKLLLMICWKPIKRIMRILP